MAHEACAGKFCEQIDGSWTKAQLDALCANCEQRFGVHSGAHPHAVFAACKRFIPPTGEVVMDSDPVYAFTLPSGETMLVGESALPNATAGWLRFNTTSIERICKACGKKITGAFLRPYGLPYHHIHEECAIELRKREWIKKKMPASLAEPWRPADQANIGHWATLSEMVVLVDMWLQHDYGVFPGTYEEVAEELSDADFPIYNDRPLMRTYDGRAFIGMHYGREYSTRSISVPGHPGARFQLGCTVCGRGGQLEATAGVGWFHAACYEWFKYSGAFEAEGFVSFPCGHTARQDMELISPEYECKDCHRPLRRNTNCPTCLGNSADARCIACTATVSTRSMAGSFKQSADLIGLDLGFNLFAAAADFYILSDLSERYHELDDLYMKRTLEIATQIARYTLAACGGELRHWYDHISSAGQLYYDINNPTYRAAPDDYFYCTSGGINNTCVVKLVLGEHHHYQITKIFGFIGAPPANRRRAGGEAVAQWNHPITIGGKTYSLAGASHDLDPFPELKGIEAKGRAGGWRQFVGAYKKHGMPLLEAMRDVFMNYNWSSGFGGQKWGLAASLLIQYVKGELTPPLFIDVILGLRHNCGILFDKTWATQMGEFGFNSLLTVRQATKSSVYLLPFASMPVREAWRAVAAKHKDAELRAGAKVIDPELRQDFPQEAYRAVKIVAASNCSQMSSYADYVGRVPTWGSQSHQENREAKARVA